MDDLKTIGDKLSKTLFKDNTTCHDACFKDNYYSASMKDPSGYAHVVFAIFSGEELQKLDTVIPDSVKNHDNLYVIWAFKRTGKPVKAIYSAKEFINERQDGQSNIPMEQFISYCENRILSKKLKYSNNKIKNKCRL